jgi:hypothetical protein
LTDGCAGPHPSTGDRRISTVQGRCRCLKAGKQHAGRPALRCGEGAGAGFWRAARRHAG